VYGDGAVALDPDFLLERIAQVVEARLNSPRLLPSDRPVQGACAAEDDQRNHEDDDQLRMRIEPNMNHTVLSARPHGSTTYGRSASPLHYRDRWIRGSRSVEPDSCRELIADTKSYLLASDMASSVSSRATTAVLVAALAGGGSATGCSRVTTGGAVPSLQCSPLGVEAHYIEPVQSDTLVYSAIGGMLQTLDPHSSFMDPGPTSSSGSDRRALLRPRHLDQRVRR